MADAATREAGRPIAWAHERRRGRGPALASDGDPAIDRRLGADMTVGRRRRSGGALRPAGRLADAPGLELAASPAMAADRSGRVGGGGRRAMASAREPARAARGGLGRSVDDLRLRAETEGAVRRSCQSRLRADVTGPGARRAARRGRGLSPPASSHSRGALSGS